MIDLKKAYDAIKTPDWVVLLASGLKGVFDLQNNSQTININITTSENTKMNERVIEIVRDYSEHMCPDCYKKLKEMKK